MNYLISVVVPVYNVEKYLHKCIDSILSQTYIYFELILIDDGSTDDSSQICDEYVNSDKRVRAFHKKNGGQSSARNLGIDVACGEYITFIDSDDFVKNNYLEIMLKLAIENNSEIVQCSFDFGDDGLFKNSNYKPLIKVYSGSHALTTSSLKVLACCKLYKSNIFEDIRFPLLKKYEDDAIYYKLIYRANKVVITNLKLYYYLQRMGSILRENSHFLSIDFIEAYNERLSFFKLKNEIILYEKSIEKYCVVLMTFYMKCKKDPQNTNNLENIYASFCEKFKMIKNTKSVSWIRKLIFYIFKIFPNISSFLVLKLKLRYKYYNVTQL